MLCQDCNGWELFDVIDAVNYMKEHYIEHILDMDPFILKQAAEEAGMLVQLSGNFRTFLLLRQLHIKFLIMEK